MHNKVSSQNMNPTDLARVSILECGRGEETGRYTQQTKTKVVLTIENPRIFHY